MTLILLQLIPVETPTGLQKDQQLHGGKQRLAIGIITVRAHRLETIGSTTSINTMAVCIPRAMAGTTGWMDCGGRFFPS